MRTKRTVLAFFFFIPTLAFSSSFHFPTLSLRNITLLGDSHLKSGILGLTRDLPVPASSSGSAFYNKPITLFNSQSNTTASFSTKFTFSITNLNPASFGDGLAFFISPNNDTIGSPGGYLGLVNSSDLSKNRFVAVEFDTRQDFHFGDPNENHVGLDVDSLSSVAMADPMVVGVDLKSGNWITAWIDYRNEEKLVRVFLSYSSFRPERPVLSVEVDLGVYFRDFEVFYVGFSGSTEWSTESHVVENWSFEVSEIGMEGRFGDGTRFEEEGRHWFFHSGTSILDNFLMLEESRLLLNFQGTGSQLATALNGFGILFMPGFITGWLSVSLKGKGSADTTASPTNSLSCEK